MHLSILESTAVRQVTGVSAVSTVKLIDIAVADNDRIYNVTSDNWASAVKPNLVSCSDTQLAAFRDRVKHEHLAGDLAHEHRLILPRNCISLRGVGVASATSTL